MSTSRIPKIRQAVPLLTKAQMELALQLLSDDFGINSAQQMELAGLHAAELCRELFLKGITQDKVVVILAGRGFKAGVALTCARRLHAWGAKVRIWHADQPPVPSEQTSKPHATLQRMGVLSVEHPKTAPALIVDGLLDAGKDVRNLQNASEMIHWANTSLAAVLSLELPSGIHPDSGAPLHAPVMRASATLCLALPYAGLMHDRARPHVGEIYLADLGVPAALWSAPGLADLKIKEGLFAEASLLKVR